MIYERRFGEDHIKNSLKQIDASTWLIGGLVLHRSLLNQSSCATNDIVTWKDDGDNSTYTLTVAPTPLPSTTAYDSPYIKLIYDTGDASAVWSIGGSAVVKVRYFEDDVTPESATVNFIRDKNPSFEIPKVLHHAFGSGLSYLFLSKIPGRRLDVAWPGLSEFWRKHYVNAVADACEEMSQWKGQRVGSGVDGKCVCEPFLIPGLRNNFTLEDFYATCEAIGMDCSNPVFLHVCISPLDVIVEDEPKSGKIGIVDFEHCGYLPQSWLRTKFLISPGIDLSEWDPSWKYRNDVAEALKHKGFDEVVDAYYAHLEAWEKQQEEDRAAAEQKKQLEDLATAKEKDRLENLPSETRL